MFLYMMAQHPLSSSYFANENRGRWCVGVGLAHTYMWADTLLPVPSKAAVCPGEVSRPPHVQLGIVPCFEPSWLVPQALKAISVSRSR